MIKAVLILGGIATFAVFLITVLLGIGTADRDGRILMPGEKALTLESGKYGVYYEEAVETGENETFEPPAGILIRVRGLGGAPDPELDLGGLGSQIGTGNRTAEEIGTLRVSEDGRYGMVVGPPPRAGARPTITVGESSADSFLRGAEAGGDPGAAHGPRRPGGDGGSQGAPAGGAASARRRRAAAEASRSSAWPSCSARARSRLRSSSGLRAQLREKWTVHPSSKSCLRACPPIFGSGQAGPWRMSGSA